MSARAALLLALLSATLAFVPTSTALDHPACLCGDPDDDGDSDGADANAIQRVLVGLDAAVAAPEKCQAIAGGGCGLLDAVVIARASSGLGPGVASACFAATTLACGGGAPAEVVCAGHPAPSAAPGTCAVESGAGPALRIRATILAPDTTWSDGEMLVDASGAIACVGCDCGAGAGGAALVACNDVVVSPGLVNASDHITFSQNAPVLDLGIRYDNRHEWRAGRNGKQEIVVPGGASLNARRAAELRQVLAGTTSILGAGAAAGMLRNLDQSSGSGFPFQAADMDSFPLGDSDGVYHAACAYPGAILTEDVADTNAYVPIVAAGIDTAANEEIGCLSQAPNDVIGPHTALSGAIAIDASDAALLRTRGTPIVWTPRNDVSLYGDTAPATLLRAAGVPIALGTDWIATGSATPLRELRCADHLDATRFGDAFADFELWRMATANAAVVAGAESVIGAISVGRQADLAFFDASARDAYRAVLDADPEDVVLVLRGGVPLHGDDALVFALDAGCEAVDVCDRDKRTCAQREFGVPFATIAAAGDFDVPIFSCGDPVDERSCEPTRESYPNGIEPGDADGDGIADASDLCPLLFAPVRPMDLGAQADADGDDLGDACDPCPLDATNQCAALADADLDGDGVRVELDNCVRIANPEQEDADGDGVGDACDGCGLGFPGHDACPASIVELRDGTIAPGTEVVFEGIVTALVTSLPSGKGFWVQTPQPVPFGGIFARTAAANPAVAIGDTVRVTGVLFDNFGEPSINTPVAEVLASGGAPPAPLVIADPASIATGGALVAQHLGLLVRVANVTVTNANPDSPQDLDRIEVTGGLRVDDLVAPELDNASFPVSTAFGSITGVLGFRNGETNLNPRSAADLVLE